MSISIFTKSFFFSSLRLVKRNVWGINQILKPFFVTLEIVNETPLIRIEAFSIKYFLNFLFILNSKT